MDKKQARWRIRCYGQVQRVGFRYTALYLAQRLSLTGWVRNLSDGSVQLEAQGHVSHLRQLLIRLKSQPHLHIVKAEVEPIPLLPGESRFRVAG